MSLWGGVKEKLTSLSGGSNNADAEILLPLSSKNEERSWQDQIEEEVCDLLPSLTLQQRLFGCAACMGFGYILSFGSFFRFAKVLKGEPGKMRLFSQVAISSNNSLRAS
mmetsp:Transcript_712/g.1152  ORF Transcript_712/g.1152 Transcript_712/m.1152 type:complete len:109 (-) Transcript_712:656-982(-)